MNEQKYPLKRSSMLKKKREIDELFTTGKKFYFNSLKILWKISEAENKVETKIFVSVPKKNIKLATKRNLLKRRIKEAVRLNVSQIKDFCSQNSINMNIAIIYSEKTIESFSDIEQNVIKSLQKIYINDSEMISISIPS